MGKNDNSDGFFMEKKKKTDLTKECLVEINAQVGNIEVVHREGTKTYILGERITRFLTQPYKYKGIYDHKKNKLIFEEFFKENDGHGADLSKFFSYAGIGLPLFLYLSRPLARERRRKTKQYKNLVEESEEKNIKKLEDKMKHIKVYKESKDSVAKDLGVILKYIDTGKSDSFISMSGEYDDDDYETGGVLLQMRIKAHQLGADAIVSYTHERGYESATGTPVKIIKKNGKKR